MGLSVTDGLSEKDLEMVAYLAKKAEKKSNPNWREERDGKKGAEYLNHPNIVVIKNTSILSKPSFVFSIKQEVKLL